MTAYKAILGIDAAQAGIAYHIIDTHNQLLARGRAPASNPGMEQLKQQLASLGLAWDEVLVAIEATGPWHLHWTQKLHALGARVYVINPLLAKRTQTPDNAIRDHKTDPVDAAGLCELLLREHQRLGRFLHQPHAPRFALQRLQSARQALRANLTNLKKTYLNTLALVFPEMRTLGLGPARQRALITLAPTPEAILALEHATLEKIAGKKTPLLLKAAGESFASAEIAQASAPALVRLAQAIGKMDDELKEFDRQIETQAPEALGARRITRAQSLPGMGAKTAVVLLANISAGLLDAPMSRRKKANKIQAQLGCEPRLRQSGQWTGKPKLSKRGNLRGRVALYQAAWCAVLNDKPMETIYRTLRARGKPHKVAIYDIGRRLIRRLVAVLEAETSPNPA